MAGMAGGKPIVGRGGRVSLVGLMNILLFPSPDFYERLHKLRALVRASVSLEIGRRAHLQSSLGGRDGAYNMLRTWTLTEFD